jgi:general stress protein CsbA
MKRLIALIVGVILIQTSLRLDWFHAWRLELGVMALAYAVVYAVRECGD